MREDLSDKAHPAKPDRVSRKRYERERAARHEAEQLLEDKSRQLFELNEALKKHATSLEEAVRVRTLDLEKARQEAEAANDAKSTFLAVMSHEIRTPLNGVLGMAAALSEGDVTEAQGEALDVILSSGDMLLTIINDILDLSKVEAGKLELEELPTSVNGLVESIGQLFQSRIQDKGLSFTRISSGLLAHGELWAELDPTRLRQVLGNLLSNAMKFTSQGAIALTAGATEQDDGRIQLQFTIRDTGSGIPEEAHTRLFQPFSQADAGITRSHGGTGLGLAISQQICREMGGGITFTSAAGDGSEFTVTVVVPRSDASREPSVDVKLERYESDLRQNRWKVLVAEDNRTNQLVLRHMLQSFDLEVTMVNDGAKALEHWRHNEVDVILMDVNMPVMDGMKTTTKIRTEEASTGRDPVPVIAISANAMLHQVNGYLEGGMTAHVAKPIRRHELIKSMARVLAHGCKGTTE